MPREVAAVMQDAQNLDDAGTLPKDDEMPCLLYGIPFTRSRLDDRW